MESKLQEQCDCFGTELFIRTGAGMTGMAHVGVGAGRNVPAMCHCYFRGHTAGAWPPFELL